MVSDEKVNTIDVSGEGLYRHSIGNERCTIGWCDGEKAAYPHPCPYGCGGLIHADFGDEECNGDYWIYTKCDRCGRSEAE